MKTKDFAKIINNLFLYFENLGTTVQGTPLSACFRNEEFPL